MEKYVLNPDTQVLLLLLSYFGRPDSEPKPLTLGEYNRLSVRLHEMKMRPSDLLNHENINVLSDFQDDKIPFRRICDLLGRGAALAFAVETWAAKGLWVISRLDDSYPSRLKAKLKGAAPPIIYGAGNSDLLDMGGLAITGSRDADDEGLAFTRSVASACASRGIPVISGGAKGVDREAASATLLEQGLVTEILPDGLSPAVVSGRYREALRTGNFCVISPFDPESGFSVGNAMGRNRLIYAIADYAMVISAQEGKGGTWAGSTENFRKRWTPLFVRSSENAPSGNRRLIEMGAIAADQESLRPESYFAKWLKQESENTKELWAKEASVAGEKSPETNSEKKKKGVISADQMSLPFID